MSRSLEELSELLSRVETILSERNGIVGDKDWYMLKLQEELGELTAEYLRLTGRKKQKSDPALTRRALEDEAADLLAMLMLFARRSNIDLEAALERKWFQYLGREGVK